MMLRRRPVSILNDGINEIPVDRYATAANRKDLVIPFFRPLYSPRLAWPASLYNGIWEYLHADGRGESVDPFGKGPFLSGGRQENGTVFKRKMSRHLFLFMTQAACGEAISRKALRPIYAYA